MVKEFCLTYDWTITGATTPSESGTESNDYEGVLEIPQSSRVVA